eukprot:s913_g2.t1
MADAKGTGVELTLVLLEATKAPQSVFKAFEMLAELDADNMPDAGTSAQSFLSRLMPVFSPTSLRQSVTNKVASCRRTAAGLQKIQGQLSAKSRQELNNTILSPEDAHLLNHVSAKLCPVAVLELSEILAPTEDDVVQVMVGNAYGLAIEAGIVFVTALLSWRLLGVNFVELTAAAISSDIDYWFFVSITVYMTYWVCLIEHTGHDFSFEFSWIP